MAKREVNSVGEISKAIIIELVVLIALFLIFAFLGPFGTHDNLLGYQRVVYWVSVGLMGFAIFRPLVILIQTLDRKLGWGFSDAAIWAAVSVIGCVPLTAFIFIVFMPTYTLGQLGLDGFFMMYLRVLAVAALINAVFYLLNRNSNSVPHTPASQDAPDAENTAAQRAAAAPRFFDRLPAQLGQNLLCLEMEDHYVRAHTDQGSTLILMRLRDAIDELDGLHGAQVHRSWWVAQAAVKTIDRDGRKLSLQLANGMTAPVARGKEAMARGLSS